MCGFCGIWGAKSHWSLKSSNPRIFAVQSISERMRERHEQSVVLNSILRGFHLEVRDWGGTQWIVEHVSNGTEIVDSIAALWPAAEKLARRKIDPLNASIFVKSSDGRKDGI